MPERARQRHRLEIDHLGKRVVPDSYYALRHRQSRKGPVLAVEQPAVDDHEAVRIIRILLTHGGGQGRKPPVRQAAGQIDGLERRAIVERARRDSRNASGNRHIRQGSASRERVGGHFRHRSCQRHRSQVLAIVWEDVLQSHPARLHEARLRHVDAHPSAIIAVTRASILGIGPDDHVFAFGDGCHHLSPATACSADVPFLYTVEAPPQEIVAALARHLPAEHQLARSGNCHRHGR